MDFKCFSEWAQLPQNSHLLFAQAEKESLFFSRRWFENLSNTALLNNQNMLFACVVEKDNVLAILPLISQDNKEWTSLHHIYSSLFTVLLVEGNKKEILNCLAKGISQLPFNQLTLEPISEEDDDINELQQALESSGLSCALYARFFNWFQLLNGQTFAEYMLDRPSRVRNTIARKQRKLAREQDYEIRLHSGKDVPQAMADFNAVYQSSWKKKEPFEDVVKGLVECFSSLAWIRLVILYIDGKPVATQLWFVVHKKASIFKLAYDEKWQEYSPGSILTQYLMEYVIDTDKVEEIDFLTGNDRYKQDWMMGRRRRWALVCKHKQEPDDKGSFLINKVKLWLGA